jgi:GAF domain-containing protein
VVVLRDLGARSTEAKTAEEAWSIAAETLAGHPKDIPFALLYLIDADREHARLAGAAGLDPGRDAAPFVIHLGDETSGDRSWPLAGALRQEEPLVVRDLSEDFQACRRGPGRTRPGWLPSSQYVLTLPIILPASWC